MGKTEQPAISKIILDAGPIIHLDEMKCLHLLLDFRKLLVPDAVWKEAERYRPDVFKNCNIPFEKILSTESQSTHITELCNAFNLDAGETHAISLCIMNPDSIFLTDDAAARLAAKSIGIRAYGTIGVLLRAIRKNQLEPADVIKKLQDIPLESTLFIRKKLLQEIVEIIRKEYSL